MVWKKSQMRFAGNAALVTALLSVAACKGDVAVMHEAKQQCQARGLDATSAAYDACVHEVSEAHTEGWGRPSGVGDYHFSRSP